MHTRDTIEICDPRLFVPDPKMELCYQVPRVGEGQIKRERQQIQLQLLGSLPLNSLTQSHPGWKKNMFYTLRTICEDQGGCKIDQAILVASTWLKIASI